MTDIHTIVREKYGTLAETGGTCSTTGACCGGGSITSNLY